MFQTLRKSGIRRDQSLCSQDRACKYTGGLRHSWKDCYVSGDSEVTTNVYGIVHSSKR